MRQSHNFTVLSADAESKVLESELKAIEFISDVWPIGNINLGFWAKHILYNASKRLTETVATFLNCIG